MSIEMFSLLKKEVQTIQTNIYTHTSKIFPIVYTENKTELPQNFYTFTINRKGFVVLFFTADAPIGRYSVYRNTIPELNWVHNRNTAASTLKHGLQYLKDVEAFREYFNATFEFSQLEDLHERFNFLVEDRLASFQNSDPQKPVKNPYEGLPISKTMGTEVPFLKISAELRPELCRYQL